MSRSDARRPSQVLSWAVAIDSSLRLSRLSSR